MTTEQFIEERQQLIENLRTLLSDHLDLWNVDDTPHEHMVLTRLVGKQNSGNAVTLRLDYCYAGNVKVAVDGVDIMLSASSSETILGMMAMFKQRWKRRVQDAEQEKESEALKALTLAMAVTPIETRESLHA